MDAVILVGGFAKRMGSLAEDFPKCLLEVNRKPIVQHIMEKLDRREEINRVYISSNQKFCDHFIAFLEKTSFAKPISLVVENTVKEQEKLGSIGALHFLLRQEKLHDDLLVVGGDNLFRFRLDRFLSFYHHQRLPLIGLYDVGSLDEARKFGVVSLNRKNRIVDFVEKPDNPTSTLVSTAIYVFPKDRLALIHDYITQGHNPDKLGYFISWLHKHHPVNGFVFTDKWFDIGSVETYEKAKRTY